MITRIGRKRQGRKGTAVVEMALVSPVLLVILLGVWEVGRLVDAEQLLNNAAREGGRQASAGQQSASQVQQVVLNYLTLSGINTSGATVTVTNMTSGLDPTVATQMDRFKITVSLPFNNVRWILLPQVTSVTTLNASAYWYSFNDLPVTVGSTIPQ